MCEMKTILQIFLYFFTFNITLLSQTIINELMINEGQEEFKSKRQEWLNNLHRCEEGLPYWIIDQKTKQILQDIEYQSKSEVIGSQEYANGRIIGQWIEKGSNNLAGRVHILDYDTNSTTIYLASAGGNIWKGTINGNDWTCLNNGKKFANPRMVKILWQGNKSRLIVVANSPASVYFTDDEGANWNKANGLENAERWGWTIRGAVTINQDVYILLNEWNFSTWKSMISLYKSSNLCKDFTKLYSVYIDYSLSDIWAPSNYKSILYFAIKDTLYKIDNQGNFHLIGTYTFIDRFVSGIQLRGFASSNKIYIYYALKTTNTQTLFYYSNDEGKNFIRTGKFDFNSFEKNSFEVSSISPSNLYFGQVEFYRSTDFGNSWKKANSWGEYYQNMESKLHADIPGIVSIRKWNKTKNNYDEYLFVCTDGGVYISFDNGATFRNLSLQNLNISQYYSIYTFDKAGKILIAGSQDQGLQINYSDNGGTLNFKQVISGDYGYLTSSNGGRHLWTTYPGFAMMVINPDKGYFDAVQWKFIGSGFLWLPPILADPENPLKAYLLSGNNQQPAGTPASYIYELTYDEAADSIVYNVLPFNFALEDVARKVSALTISPINRNFWFALSNDGKFFRSIDRGITWQLIENVAGPKGHYFYGNKIVASKYNLGRIIIAGSGYSNPGVLISNDTGKTFQQLGTNIPSTLFYDIELNSEESLLFAATEIGPFVYHFYEKKWYFLGGSNCPDNIFWDVEYLQSLNTVRFATYGRGIWDFKIEKVLSIPTDTDVFTEKIHLEIIQSAFSEDIIIEVKCNPGSFLNISVYDVEGRHVKTLWNGYTSSDCLQLLWNGTTDQNNKLPSGKYFCIVSGNGIAKYSSISLVR